MARDALGTDYAAFRTHALRIQAVRPLSRLHLPRQAQVAGIICNVKHSGNDGLGGGA